MYILKDTLIYSKIIHSLLANHLTGKPLLCKDALNKEHKGCFMFETIVFDTEVYVLNFDNVVSHQDHLFHVLHGD